MSRAATPAPKISKSLPSGGHGKGWHHAGKLLATFIYIFIFHIHIYIYIYIHIYREKERFARVESSDTSAENIDITAVRWTRHTVSWTGYMGTSPTKKRPPPWDPPRTLGIGLR